MHPADAANLDRDNHRMATEHEHAREERRDGSGEFAPPPHVDDAPIAELRREYAAEAEALGAHPSPFLDKLGARLSFERAGVRMYQALIAKHDVFGSFAGGPARTALEDILEQEHAHFLLLGQAAEQLGVDPAALTPSAASEDTAASGLRALLVDPRVNLVRSFEALLIVELADNEGWDGLVELAALAGEHELAARFRAALEQEREHLRKVRGWLSAFRRGG
jgi:hypothetical protein